MVVSPPPLFIRDRTTWLAYWMLAYVAYVAATLGPLMPFLRQELSLSYTLGGLLLSALAVGMILAGLTGDHIAQRWGRRSVFWSGGAALAMGVVSLALSRQVGLAIASVLIMGFGGSLALVMVQAILADRHGERRAIALTESNVAASVSASLAPLCVGGLERVGVGWRFALLLAALAFGLIAARFRTESVPEVLPTATGSSGFGRPGLPSSFWGLWIVVCLVVSIEWCLVIWGADFLETVVGLSRTDAATTMSLFFLAMVVGRIAGSAMTRVMPGATLLLIALGTALAGFPLFWLARLAFLNIAGLFIAGLGVANLFPLTLSVAVGLAPRHADTASARVSLGVGLAVLVAPLLLGRAADLIGLQDAYGLVAVLLMIAIIITLVNGRVPAPWQADP